MQVRRFEVVQTLSKTNSVQCLDGFEFYEYRAAHQQVRRVLTDDKAIIPHDDTVLLNHGETTLAKLVSERVLVNLLDKSRSERIGNELRVCAARSRRRSSVG